MNPVVMLASLEEAVLSPQTKWTAAAKDGDETDHFIGRGVEWTIQLVTARDMRLGAASSTLGGVVMRLPDELANLAEQKARAAVKGKTA